jgi:energy-converting hydrogenase B subunit D
MLIEILLLISVTASLLLTYKTLVERDLLKAIVYSAAQSVFFALLFLVLMSPDVALAYAAVGVGVYSALFLTALAKTERYERGDEE